MRKNLSCKTSDFKKDINLLEIKKSLKTKNSNSKNKDKDNEKKYKNIKVNHKVNIKKVKLI